MTIREIKQYVIACDKCRNSNKKMVIPEDEDVRIPKGWVTIRYSTEGGGHYGLPHHHYTAHICPLCVAKHKDSKPKGCFDFHREEH